MCSHLLLTRALNNPTSSVHVSVCAAWCFRGYLFRNMCHSNISSQCWWFWCGAAVKKTLMMSEASAAGGWMGEGAGCDPVTAGEGEGDTESQVENQSRDGTVAEVAVCQCKQQQQQQQVWLPFWECCWGCPGFGGWRKWHQQWTWYSRRIYHAACSHEHTGGGTPPPLNGGTSCVGICRRTLMFTFYFVDEQNLHLHNIQKKPDCCSSFSKTRWLIKLEKMLNLH